MTRRRMANDDDIEDIEDIEDVEDNDGGDSGENFDNDDDLMTVPTLTMTLTMTWTAVPTLTMALTMTWTAVPTLTTGLKAAKTTTAKIELVTTLVTTWATPLTNITMPNTTARF